MAEMEKRNTDFVFTASGITVDIDNATVVKNGENIYLSMLEYRILLILVKNAGQVVPRKTILESISYGNCRYLNENTLTVYVKRIREKLGDKPNRPRIIKTVRGTGYIVEK